MGRWQFNAMPEVSQACTPITKLAPIEGRLGDRARRGSGERDRIRLSLGITNGDAAQVCLSKVERALTAGPDSLLWNELSKFLPPDTFTKLAAIVGYQAIPEPQRHTWEDLASRFKAWMPQRIALDKMRDSTRIRYEQTCKNFGEFLRAAQSHISMKSLAL
jgi:hypothetical protein